MPVKGSRGTNVVLSAWEANFVFNVLDDPDWYNSGPFWESDLQDKETALMEKLRAAKARRQA